MDQGLVELSTKSVLVPVQLRSNCFGGASGAAVTGIETKTKHTRPRRILTFGASFAASAPFKFATRNFGLWLELPTRMVSPNHARLQVRARNWNHFLALTGVGSFAATPAQRSLPLAFTRHLYYQPNHDRPVQDEITLANPLFWTLITKGTRSLTWGAAMHRVDVCSVVDREQPTAAMQLMSSGSARHWRQGIRPMAHEIWWEIGAVRPA